MILPGQKTGFTSVAHHFSFHDKKKLTLMQPHIKLDARVIHLLCKTKRLTTAEILDRCFPMHSQFAVSASEALFFFGTCSVGCYDFWLRAGL